MEHSYSLSNGPRLSPGQHSLTSNHASAVTSTNHTNPPPRLNQQSRRLQLRNVGFRGPVLPARRISPIISASQHGSESFNRPVNSENTPISTDRRMLYGEDLPPSPVNILQEIHNSKRRRRVSPRSGFGQIFEDTTGTESIEQGGTFWYNETSNNGSPARLTMTPANTIKLHEISLNGKTPPSLGSHLAKQGNGNNENRPSLRSASSEAAKYIEHLETQLCAANAKLDTVMSPTTHKARSAKLRALTAESRSLRQEVSEWERHFTERVGEETGQHLDVEAGLKTRLQVLEDDLEVKGAKIRELETELEGIRAKVKDAEVLEAVNVDLERRIDVLTNLLVRSPTKLELHSATSSPSKADPSKRTPRPRSMLPRVAFSPGGARLSVSSVSESGFRHSMSFGSTSSISESPEGADPTKTHEGETMSPVSNRNSRQFNSTNLDSGTSTLFHSGPSSSSRPNSIQSASSFGTASWGLPFPPDTENNANNRQRRMRRFPSGSYSLKPLILPTATTIPSLPASAPIYPCSPTPSRNITDISLDPTTAFLSRHDLGSPTSAPTPSNQRDSAAWAQEQALRSLEGRNRQLEPVDVQPSNPEDERAPLNESSSEACTFRRVRPRSLREELEQDNLLIEESFEDGLIPVDLDEDAQLKPVSSGLSPLQSHTPSQNNLLRDRQPSPTSDTTPKPRPKSASAIPRPPQTTPTSTLAAQNTSSIFSYLINLINRTKQEPLTLAQRLLYNAWVLGSARLGGVGWWLIGLVFGSSCRKSKRAADGRTADGTKSRLRNDGFDWHHYSARASRQRTAKQFLRDQGAEYQIQKTPQPQSSTTVYSRLIEESQVFPCDKCIETSSHRTLRLWWQFTLAMVLAVGVAIKYGPGVLLVDDSMAPSPPSARRPPSRISSRQLLRLDAADPAASNSLADRAAENDGGGGMSRTFTFLEPMCPGDFEHT